MVKKIYFHLEIANGNCFELLASAYKDPDLQLKNNGLKEISCCEELCNTETISRDLLNEMYKVTYGSPMGRHCRVKLEEIKTVRGTNIGLLDINKVLKTTEFDSVVMCIAEYLGDNNLKLKDTRNYRVIVEMEK